MFLSDASVSSRKTQKAVKKIFASVSISLHFALFPTAREKWSSKKGFLVSEFLSKASVARESKPGSVRPSEGEEKSQHRKALERLL